MLAALMLSATAMFAAPVDSVQAKRVAEDFVARRLKTEGAVSRMVSRGEALQPCQLPLSAEQQDAVYLYNMADGAGFVLVSGDDRTAPVLAYGFNENIDVQNMSDGFRAMLQQYAEAIDKIRRADASVAQIGEYGKDGNQHSWSQSWSAVQPLITTTWSQDSPYNLLAPRQGGNLCLTGCLATVMAQVMKRWEHPASVDAIPDYTAYDGRRYDGCQPTTFKWNLMSDSYDAGSSTESRNAVAELMNACGRAVKMGFSTYFSGASGGDGLVALFKHFNYDGSLHMANAFSYSYIDWEKLMYDEVSAGRPVVYFGYTKAMGGHAYACDGFDNGYFHINFGWGGKSDGYYLLTIYDGGQNVYNIGNEAIVGIKPYEGTPFEQPAGWNVNPISNDVKGDTALVLMLENESADPITVYYNVAFADDPNLTPLMENSVKLDFNAYDDLELILSPSFAPANTPGYHTAYVMRKVEGGEWEIMTKARYFEVYYDSLGELVSSRFVDQDLPKLDFSIVNSADLITMPENGDLQLQVKFENRNAHMDAMSKVTYMRNKKVLYNFNTLTPYHSYVITQHAPAGFKISMATIGSNQTGDVLYTNLFTVRKASIFVPVTISGNTVTLSTASVGTESGKYCHIVSIEQDGNVAPVVLNLEADGSAGFASTGRICLVRSSSADALTDLSGTEIADELEYIRFHSVDNQCIKGVPGSEAGSLSVITLAAGESTYTGLTVSDMEPGVYEYVFTDQMCGRTYAQYIYVEPLSTAIMGVSADSAPLSPVKRLTPQRRIVIERYGHIYDAAGQKQ